MLAKMDSYMTHQRDTHTFDLRLSLSDLETFMPTAAMPHDILVGCARSASTVSDEVSRLFQDSENRSIMNYLGRCMSFLRTLAQRASCIRMIESEDHTIGCDIETYRYSHISDALGTVVNSAWDWTPSMNRETRCYRP